MRRFVYPAFAIYLLALGVGSAWLADQAWQSVTGYRPGAVADREWPAGKPLAERLVLIVADGVRADAVGAMPAWQALADRGAAGLVEAPQPSLSNPARATMTTGARPEVHGVTHNGFERPPATQSLFSEAHRIGTPAAAYGSDFWTRAYGSYLDPVRLFEKELHVVDDPAELVDWQDEVCDRLVPFAAEQRSGLVVVGLTAGDAAGHDFGGASGAYRTVLESVDRCLGRVVEAMDDVGTAFLVVADHGHIDRRGRGGHGGSEPEVVEAPFVLAGPGVRQAEGVRGLMRDIAPTAAILAGLPIPADNQGEPLWQALERRPSDEARVREQREAEAAFRPARDVVRAQERIERLAVAGAALAWFVFVLAAAVRLESEPWPRFALAVPVFFVLYAWFFWTFGLGYSLSAIVRQEYTNSFFLRDVTAAALAFFIARRLIRSDDAGESRRRSLRFALAATSLFGLRAAWIALDSGLLMGRTMPDLPSAFAAYLDLLAMLGVGVVAFVSAATSALLSRRAERAAGSVP